MIEQVIIEYLSNELNVPVSGQIPEGPEDRFVIVERTAGGMTDHLESALVAIQSYAPSMYEAALLNRTVRDRMLEAVQLAEVSSCRLSSSYNFTDTTTRRYRYQSVYDITFYD